jgi:hypothetical protein
MKQTLTKMPGARAKVVHTYAMIPIIASKSPANVRITQTLLHLHNTLYASSNSGAVTVPDSEEEAENIWVDADGFVLRRFRK